MPAAKRNGVSSSQLLDWRSPAWAVAVAVLLAAGCSERASEPAGAAKAQDAALRSGERASGERPSGDQPATGGAASTANQTNTNEQPAAPASGAGPAMLDGVVSIDDAPPTGVTAGEVLQKMTAAYRAADSYFDNAEYRERFVQRRSGVPREPPPHQVSVVFARPNRCRITRREPNPDGSDDVVTVLSDGRRWVATAGKTANRGDPAEDPPPGLLFDGPAPEELSLATLRSDRPLFDAVLPNPIEYLLPQLDLLIATDAAPPRLLADTDAKLLPSGTLRLGPGREAPCFRIELRRAFGVFTAWVDQQEHLLRRLEMPTERVRRELDPGRDLIRLDLWIDFLDASFDTMIGEATFRIDLAAKKPEQDAASDDNSDGGATTADDPPSE
ncbi:MAG: hypothetical protein AAF790_13165 [Planctomycetota bacterium]